MDRGKHPESEDGASITLSVIGFHSGSNRGGVGVESFQPRKLHDGLGIPCEGFL
jgi:hypothetical protein